jgi:hypothetical protein
MNKKKTIPGKKRDRNQDTKGKRVVDLTDVQLQQVSGGLAFCTTPWD